MLSTKAMGQGAPLRIYFVDDDEELRFLVCEGLREQGYIVEEMGNLAEAKQALSQASLSVRRRPDIVLIDYYLADGRGTDLIGWMKSQGASSPLASLPTVILSADKDLRQVAAGAGADGFVAKPPALSELVDEVLRCVAY